MIQVLTGYVAYAHCDKSATYSGWAKKPD